MFGYDQSENCPEPEYVQEGHVQEGQGECAGVFDSTTCYTMIGNAEHYQSKCCDLDKDEDVTFCDYILLLVFESFLSEHDTYGMKIPLQSPSELNLASYAGCTNGYPPH